MGPIVKAVVAILGTQYREMKTFKPLRICVNMVIVQKILSLTDFYTPIPNHGNANGIISPFFPIIS